MSSTTSITILLPSGRLPLDLMKEIQTLSEKYSLGIYLTTQQNMRIFNIPADSFDTIKSTLASYDVIFKAPGLFPMPRICIGKPHCNLGLIDTDELSNEILSHFKNREKTKPKLKIAISGCALCCSSAKTTDIGIIATKKGLSLFAGGRGGPRPMEGKMILQNADSKEVIQTMEKIFDYHDTNTPKKQRLQNLMSKPDYPFSEIS